MKAQQPKMIWAALNSENSFAISIIKKVVVSLLAESLP